MPVATVEDLAAALEQLQAQMAEMSKHIEFLEHGNGVSGRTVVAPEQPAAAAPAHVEPVPAGITEEELLAISAALGAYLGVRAHIRQIRLVSTTAWAQQGRVSIQASHRLQG
jgi:methylmalonyl-CoA carboxyltransferase large subunit